MNPDIKLLDAAAIISGPGLPRSDDRIDLAPDGSAWFADRIKVVEDQRAADVAEIHSLRVEVAALKDAVLARDEVINDLRARVWSSE